MTDPIADMIIRIKNGYLARKKSVSLPYSKMNKSIADILVTEKYLDSINVAGEGIEKSIELVLRYVGKVPSLTNVKRESKPGRRLYSTAHKLPQALGGYGIVIVSTNKGVMTDKDARKQSVGGEVLCSIW
ncbi:MAG: 30S ribosomal protein S8 [Patescibacteria group bacterium]